MPDGCGHVSYLSGYGKESSVQLNNLDSEGVLQAMEKLVASGTSAWASWDDISDLCTVL